MVPEQTLQNETEADADCTRACALDARTTGSQGGSKSTDQGQSENVQSRGTHEARSVPFYSNTRPEFLPFPTLSERSD